MMLPPAPIMTCLAVAGHGALVAAIGSELSSAHRASGQAMSSSIDVRDENVERPRARRSRSPRQRWAARAHDAWRTREPAGPH